MKPTAGIKQIWRYLTINRGPLAITAGSFVLVAAFLYFFYLPPATSIGPAQPIPFSHRVHASVKAIQCRFCHSYVDRSIHPGLPPVEKCLYCHNHIIANHPQIKKEHRYFNEGRPVPWKKVYYVPEHVLFNHQRHIRKDIACEKCHGRVATMDRLREHKFTMGFCITCHQENNANLDCWLACHS